MSLRRRHPRRTHELNPWRPFAAWCWLVGHRTHAVIGHSLEVGGEVCERCLTYRRAGRYGPGGWEPAPRLRPIPVWSIPATAAGGALLGHTTPPPPTRPSMWASSSSSNTTRLQVRP